VTSVLVSPGSVLQARDLYMAVATDKIDIELELGFPAVVLEVPVRPGDVVAAGGVLLVVDVDDDVEEVERLTEISNVEIGLRYLASRDASSVCSRPELKSYKFSEYEVFVERTAAIASQLRDMNPVGFDPDLVNDLRAVLFQLTRLVSEMDGFRPERRGDEVLDHHSEVKWRVGVHSEESLRRFEQLLSAASGGYGLPQTEGEERRYVFVTYSHKDRPFVDRFCGRLGDQGIRFFRDERVEPGEELVERVEKELARATHVVVIISSASLQSQWVAYEIGFARGRGITVVPYIIYPGLKMPGFISRYRYLQREEEAVFIERLAGFEREAPGV